MKMNPIATMNLLVLIYATGGTLAVDQAGLMLNDVSYRTKHSLRPQKQASRQLQAVLDITYPSTRVRVGTKYSQIVIPAVACHPSMCLLEQMHACLVLAQNLVMGLFLGVDSMMRYIGVIFSNVAYACNRDGDEEEGYVSSWRHGMSLTPPQESSIPQQGATSKSDCSSRATE
jgi:hypothetical protein